MQVVMIMMMIPQGDDSSCASLNTTFICISCMHVWWWFNVRT